MEIRTCEEYVLAELLDAKNEVERLTTLVSQKEEEHQETINKLKDVMKAFQELKDLIYKISSVNNHGDYTYISFSSIYDSWDRDDFGELLRLAPGILKKSVE